MSVNLGDTIRLLDTISRLTCENGKLKDENAALRRVVDAARKLFFDLAPGVTWHPVPLAEKLKDALRALDEGRGPCGST